MEKHGCCFFLIDDTVCFKCAWILRGCEGNSGAEVFLTRWSSLIHMSGFAVFYLATYQPHSRYPTQLQEQTTGTVALHRTWSRSLQKLQTGRPHEEDESSAAVGHLSLCVFIWDCLICFHLLCCFLEAVSSIDEILCVIQWLLNHYVFSRNTWWFYYYYKFNQLSISMDSVRGKTCSANSAGVFFP